MVKKKHKNTHAKDYAIGGGALSTTAKVTAIPHCDTINILVTRQPGHGELKGTNAEEAGALHDLASNALQSEEWKQTNPVLASTWEEGRQGRRIKHVLGLIDSFVSKYYADEGSSEEIEEAQLDVMHTLWELCASSEWRPYIAASKEQATKIMDLLFSIPLKTKSVGVCKVTLHIMWSLVSKVDELCSSAVNAGLVAALVAAANLVDGIVDIEPEVTSLWCRVLASAFGDGTHNTPTELEASLCSEFVRIGGVKCIVKLLESTDGHRDYFSLVHLLMLALQCEKATHYPTLLLQRRPDLVSTSLSELQTSSVSLADPMQASVGAEGTAPARSLSLEGSEDESSNERQAIEDDALPLLVRLMDNAPGAAVLVIAQLARSRQGLACLAAFKTACREPLGTFMNRCVREIVGKFKNSKARSVDIQAADQKYPVMSEPEAVEIVNDEEEVCRFEIDPKDGRLSYSKCNEPILLMVTKFDTQSSVLQKEKVSLVLQGTPTGTKEAPGGADTMTAECAIDWGKKATNDIRQILQLTEYSAVAEKSNLADYVMLLRQACVAWCACVVSQRAPFDAEIREYFEASFDASSAYADYPPIDGSSIAAWDLVLACAAEDTISTWAVLIVLGTQLAELRLSGGDQYARGVAWLYGEPNRSSRILTKLLIFIDPANHTPEVIDAAASATLNLISSRQTVDVASKSGIFNRSALLLLLDAIGNIAEASRQNGPYHRRGQKAMEFLSFALVQLMSWQESEPQTNVEYEKALQTVQTMLRFGTFCKNASVSTYALCSLWCMCKRQRGLALSAEKNMMSVVLQKLKEISSVSSYFRTGESLSSESQVDVPVPETKQNGAIHNRDCQTWCLAVIWLMVFSAKPRLQFRECEWSYRLCVLIIRTSSDEGPLLAASAVATILCSSDGVDVSRNNGEATPVSPPGQPWSATWKDKKWKPHYACFGTLLTESLVHVVANNELSARTRIRAVALLQHLVKVSKRHGKEILRCGLSCGILTLYVQMLCQDGNEELQEHAAIEIARLACEHHYREAALELGATQRLIQLLTDVTVRASYGGTDGSGVLQRETLLNALLNLSMESPGNQRLICSESLQLMLSMLLGTDFIDVPRDSAMGGADNVSISSNSVTPLPLTDREQGFVDGILTNLKRNVENRADLYLAQLAIATQTTGMDRGEKQSASTLESYARRSRTHNFHQLMRRSIYDSWSEKPHFHVEPQSTWGPVEVERGPKRVQAGPTNKRAQGSRLWDPASVGALAGDVCLDVDNDTGLERTRVLIRFAKSESQLTKSGSLDLARYNFKISEGDAGPKEVPSPDSKPQTAPNTVKFSPQGTTSAAMLSSAAMSTMPVGTMIRDHDSHRQRNMKRSGECGNMAIWRSSGGPTSEGMFPKIQLTDGSVFHAFHTEIPGEAAEEPVPQKSLGPPLTFQDVTGCGTGFEHPETRLYPFNDNVEPYGDDDEEYNAFCRFRVYFDDQLSPFYYAPKLRPARALTPPSLLTISDGEFTLSTSEEKIVTPREAPPPPKPPGPPWDWKTKSIFVPRSKEDVGSMEDNDRKNKAFALDWAKCLEKEERFLNLIKKGAPNDEDKDIKAVKQVLKAQYAFILHVFKTFAAVDETATNCSYMGWMSFSELLTTAGITDPESDTCKQTHLDTIFKAANFDNTKGKGGHNPMEGLNRSEFIECLIRISKAKFGKSSVSIKHALEALLKLILEKLTEDVMCSVEYYHSFRLNSLYVEETDKVYRKWESKLKALYDSRISSDVAMAKCWTLDRWKKFMEECGMFNEASFSREEGNFAYYYSKFLVYDFEKKWDRYEGMNWLSFLEALGRMTDYKELPRQADLERYGISKEGGLPEFVDRIADEGKTWDAWMQENSKEDGAEDPFHHRLDQLLSLIFHVLERSTRKKVERNAEEQKEPAEEGQPTASDTKADSGDKKGASSSEKGSASKGKAKKKK